MKIRRVIFVGTIFALLTTRWVAAQECVPRPDAWFAEVFRVHPPEDFPETLELATSPKEVAHGYLEIINHSHAALFVLPYNARDQMITTIQPALADDDLAEELTPQVVVHFEQVPNLAAFVINDDESLRLDTISLTALLPYIEDRNQFDFTRPGLVLLPITQRGAFYLAHDAAVYEVEITIHYALNEGFNPETCDQEFAAQRESGIIPDPHLFYAQLGGIALLIAIVVAAGSVLYHYAAR